MKKKQKKTSESLSLFLANCFGIIFIALSIIALTGKTVIGSTLTYCFAYLFGVFYPFFFAFFIVLGIRLLIKKSPFPLKGYSLIWVGILLTFFALLCLSSFSYRGIEELSFYDVASAYQIRMKGFASSILSIDSYGNLGTLGGGYLGLFFFALLQSVWGKIGNGIFFVVVLLAGIFFLSYYAVIFIAADVKKRKENKVAYDSPFHKKKGRKEQHLDRNDDYEEVPNTDYLKPDPNLCAPLEKDWRGNKNAQNVNVSFAPKESSTPFQEETPIVQDSRIVTQKTQSVPPITPAPIVSPIVQPRSESHANFDDIAPIYQRQTVQQPPVQQQVEQPPVTQQPQVQQVQEQPRVVPQAPVQQEAPITQAPLPQETKPVEPVIPPQVQPVEMPKHIQELQTVEETPATPQPIQEEKKEPVHPLPQYERVNPLEAVARNVQPKEKQEHTVEIKTSEPAPEMIEEKKPAELTEEEKQRQTEKEYFRKKREKALEEAREKEARKLRKKQELLQFVSDVPKIYDYALPTDSLLSDHDDSKKMQTNNLAAEKRVEIINNVLRNYDVKAKAVSYTVGASVTRFNIETEPGERSDRISSLVDEFKRALNGDKTVRVETVVEGRSTSGIEVGNAAPMAVSFREVFENIEVNTKDNLLLPIGKDVSGNVIIYPLNKMPHLLIAGTTGSGKSVLVHSMILTLIMRNYPSQMKLILIDPKQVEFVRYRDCSHLFCPVISQPNTAVQALKKLVDEMERRFHMLSEYKLSNFEEYLAYRVGKEAFLPELPYLVCVIDEFADLMMVGGKDVTINVQRLGQKARAAGIHLIIATQRPSKDNVPMTIKANIPCRIGLSCSSQVDSRVILDEVGAETLLGKGDLLFKNPTKKSLIRAQSPFLANDEIDRVLAYVKDKAGTPVYDKAFIELAEMEEEDEAQIEEDPTKALYDRVKDFVINTGITSKESLMRNFQLSSQKAEQFLTTMASQQILMPGYEGKYELGPAVFSFHNEVKS